MEADETEKGGAPGPTAKEELPAVKKLDFQLNAAKFKSEAHVSQLPHHLCLGSLLLRALLKV